MAHTYCSLYSEDGYICTDNDISDDVTSSEINISESIWKEKIQGPKKKKSLSSGSLNVIEKTLEMTVSHDKKQVRNYTRQLD